MFCDVVWPRGRACCTVQGNEMYSDGCPSGYYVVAHEGPNLTNMYLPQDGNEMSN